MDNPHQIDWSLIRVFLAVAETGTLSGAARMLGSSQPTVGRQIRLVEEQVGADLFRRVPRGLKLTDAGAALVASAQAMRDAAHAFELQAAGQDQGISGTVRVTASVFVSHYVLPPILASIRQAEPDIDIDLLPTDTSENLLFREADIAVRMYEPKQLDVITKRLGSIGIGLFAARSYLERRGRPAGPADLSDHDLIGYDSDDRIVRGLQAAGFPATRDWFRVRTDAQATYWELVRAGCGIGFSQLPTGRADPTVEQILPELPIPGLPVWLAAAEAMRHTPRIRRVWDLLESGLRPFVS